MTALFQPLTIREVNFKNRIFLSPMCQYSAKDGMPNDWHMVHLGSRAVGGASLVMVEATAVTPAGRISPADLGLWNDEQMEAFKPIVRFIKGQGAVPAIQLAHSGRKGSTDIPWQGGKPLSPGDGGWIPVAPSAIPFDQGYATPIALDQDGLAGIRRAFQEAAKRAYAAGFEVIEIHMAHGYLLHEFLSPFSNQRSDTYGGSLANRMRFPLEVAECIREVWPSHLPLFVRISASDWKEGGWDIHQSVELAKRLKALNVDLIDCSSGGILPDVLPEAKPNYQVPFAEQIKKEAEMLTGAVGLITETEQANAIVADSKADAVLIGRAFLRDPYWALHAALALHIEQDWPKHYQRAFATEFLR